MKNWLAIFSALSLSLAQVACSGAKESGTGCPECDDSPIPAGRICEVVKADVCVALSECSGATFASLEDCIADRECGGEGDFLEALERGWLDYDEAAAGRCHARFQADPCAFGFFLFVPDLMAVLETCGDVLSPRQGFDEPCSEDTHCVGEAFCAMEMACPGVCTPLGELGAPCEWTSECLDGLLCIDDECATLPAVGEPCASGRRCVDEAYCSRTDDHCAPRLGVGAECETIDRPCREGLFCAADTFEPGTCQPLSGEGGPCTWNPDCLDDLVCRQIDSLLLGECVVRPSEGEECFQTFECEAGLRCLEEECVPYAGLGEECSSGFGAPPCAEGLLCDGARCVMPLPVGADCDVDDGMCSGSRCVDGVCVARLGLGEACETHDECRSRRCEGGVCVDYPACLN